MNDHLVLLVNPPPVFGATYCLENLGMAHVAASMRAEARTEVRLWDCALLDPQLDRFPEVIMRLRPAAIGLTLTSANASGGLRCVEIARAISPDIRVLLGGVLVRGLTPNDIARFSPDIIVYGDIEPVCAEVCQLLRLPRSATSPPTTLGSPEGLLVSQPAMWQWPARDMLPAQLRRQFQISISSSRGCLCRCSFCSIPQCIDEARAWRARDPREVAEEMTQLHTRFGPVRFYFVDENFIHRGRGSQDRGVALAEAAGRGVPHMRFGIMCRSDSVEVNVFRELRRLGLDTVFLGIESMNDTQLRRFAKDVTADEHRRAVEVLHGLGIVISPGYILSDPWSTLDEMSDSISGLKTLGGGFFNCVDSQLTCYRGSAAERNLGDLRMPTSTDAMGIVQYRFKNNEVSDFVQLVRRVLREDLAQCASSRHQRDLSLAVYEVGVLSEQLDLPAEMVGLLHDAKLGWASAHIDFLTFLARAAANKRSHVSEDDIALAIERADALWEAANEKARTYLWELWQKLRITLTGSCRHEHEWLVAILQVGLSDTSGMFAIDRFAGFWSEMDVRAKRVCAWIVGYSSAANAQELIRCALDDDDRLVVLNALGSAARAFFDVPPHVLCAIETKWPHDEEIASDIARLAERLRDRLGADLGEIA